MFFAGYVVLQYIVLATAWNILGGYTGYVNFGTAAFFALGAYTTVVLHKTVPILPLPVMMLVGGMISGLIGLGMGYLTLRLRGTFFSIATLAMAVVAQTLITNWNFVGGSRGAYIIRPADSPIFPGDYIQYLFVVMLVLCGHLGRDRTSNPAFPPRLRLLRDSRRRTRGRGIGCADLAAEADRNRACRAVSWAWPEHRCRIM